MHEFDFVKQIKESTDIKYLNDMIGYIDIDIETAKKQSPFMIKQRAKMFNISESDVIQKQVKSLNDLKDLVINRIKELDNEVV